MKHTHFWLSKSHANLFLETTEAYEDALPTAPRRVPTYIKLFWRSKENTPRSYTNTQCFFVDMNMEGGPDSNTMI